MNDTTEILEIDNDELLAAVTGGCESPSLGYGGGGSLGDLECRLGIDLHLEHLL